MRHSLAFALRRLRRLGFAALLVPPLILVAGQALRFWNDVTDPASAYFDPQMIAVPSPQYMGEPLYLFYRRAIHRPFTGRYAVTVELERGGFPVCDNSTDHLYRPKPNMQLTIVVSLADFVGEPCALAPGDYVLRATWWLFLPWHHEQAITRESGVFTILPPR